MARDILFERGDEIATITLNRPDKRNALTPGMIREMCDGVAQLRDDPAVRVLVVRANGPAFCAGLDTKKPYGQPDDVWNHEDPGELLSPKWQQVWKPVVCAVNGVAAGAGANFALACDLVLAARSASFLQAFSKIALVPDCGGTYFLPRLVGLQRAMGMALLAERVSAEDAERWGLIWKCVDDAQLMDEANALARALAAGPTHTYGMIKKALYASSGNTLEQQLDLERDFQREVGRHGDYREGVAAFLEKRKPAFTGR